MLIERFRAACMVGVAALLASTLVACERSTSGACEAQCACLGCTEEEWASCNFNAMNDAEAISFTNCTGEYDDFVTCIELEAICEDGFDTGPCASLEETYRSCLRNVRE
jgi:hypothetical protein